MIPDPRPTLSPRIFHTLNIILDLIVLIMLFYTITIEYPTYQHYADNCAKTCSFIGFDLVNLTLINNTTSP